MHEWWTGLLEHSVQSPGWWSSVLQGAVASVLGLAGLFGVFHLTRRHEIDRDRRAREAEQKKAADDRTLQGVAQIMQTALGIRTEPLDSNEQAFVLADELMMFCVREIRDHPNAARWAREQSTEVIECSKPQHDIRALPWQAGMVAALLTEWVHKGFPETMLKPSASDGKPDRYRPPIPDDGPIIRRSDVKNPSPEVAKKLLDIAGLDSKDFGL